MIKGKTASGFEYEIDPMIADDMEFVDMVADAARGGKTPRELITYMLGEAGRVALYEHCRAPGENGRKGRVSYKAVDAEVGEILEAINNHEETKNL